MTNEKDENGNWIAFNGVEDEEFINLFTSLDKVFIFFIMRYLLLFLRWHKPFYSRCNQRHNRLLASEQFQV